ncbi:MAG: hypothetical protein KC561_08735, partial [Myxococcales bacterium]|nr:hypothetical protein [Myxococcales bacterium]
MRRQQKASISPFLLLTLLGIAIAVTSCADANVGTTPGGNQQVEDVTPDESNTSSDADATDSTASDTRDLAGDDQGEGEDQVGEPDESEVPEDLGNQGGEDIPFIPDVVEEVHVVVGSCPADGVNICKTPTNNVLEQFGPKNEAITFRVINWRTDRLILQYS